jgi:CheY-like chemotaxis protein
VQRLAERMGFVPVAAAAVGGVPSCYYHRHRGPHGGSGSALSVLVVDDDAAVLRLLGTVLRRRGLEVRLAANGPEAADAYRDRGRGFDVVLMDVHMDGVDGPQAQALLRAADPAVRCCFMTAGPQGYSEEALLGLGALGVLRKPFDDLAGLADLLRRLAR